jgi:hypothetical protein
VIRYRPIQLERQTMSAPVQVFGRRRSRPDHALWRPAAEKRQGTKSRGVEHQLGSKRYGDLMLAPASTVDAALCGCEVHMCGHGRSGECSGRFDPAWQGINGRPGY